MTVLPNYPPIYDGELPDCDSCEGVLKVDGRQVPNGMTGEDQDEIYVFERGREYKTTGAFNIVHASPGTRYRYYLNISGLYKVSEDGEVVYDRPPGYITVRSELYGRDECTVDTSGHCSLRPELVIPKEFSERYDGFIVNDILVSVDGRKEHTIFKNAYDFVERHNPLRFNGKATLRQQPVPVKSNDLQSSTAPIPTGSVTNDVSSNRQFAGEIRWMRGTGVSTGWPDGTYRPLSPVTREAMAAFLYRLVGSPYPSFYAEGEPTFTDVKPGHKFYKEIQWMNIEGVSTGWSNEANGTKTFRPNEPVSREAMAAFLYRLCSEQGDKCAVPLNPLVMDTKGVNMFPDVASDNPFRKEIAWLLAARVTSGWPDNTFRPHQPIHRDAMAAFLYRLKHNKLK